MSDVKYDFNERFQFKILSLLVLVPNFQLQFGSTIVPDYFENSTHATLCTIITDYAAKYQKAPSPEGLENLIVEHCRKNRYNRTDPEHAAQLTRLGRALYRTDISDKENVIDRVLDFARKRELQVAILAATDIFDVRGGGSLSNEDYEKIYAMVNRVRMVGEGTGTLGTNTLAIMPDLPRMLNNGSAYSLSKALKTPFHAFDKSRTSKGLGPCESLYILGATGQGKSIIKANIGLHAAVQLMRDKRWVAHATLELSEIDNHIRYTANILDLTQEEIVADPKKFKHRVAQVTMSAQIYVKWFRPLTTTPNSIANWLAQLTAKLGTPPGLLIVDYPDKMRPSHKNAFTGNLYQDGATISDEFIGILSDYQMPGIFSSQLQRAMQYTDDANSSGVATSMAKIYNCDVCGVIKQNREDKTKGRGSIYWDKNRRGRDSFTTYFNIDYEKARVVECERPVSQIAAAIKKVQLNEAELEHEPA